MSESRSWRRGAGLVAALAVTCLFGASNPSEAHGRRHGQEHFRRIATFPVFENTSVDVETVAEIVTATEDGRTLIYTDSEQELLGFVDIRNPADPQAGGVVALPGEPTSVGVSGPYALVCVNTSQDFVNVSGSLLVIDIDTKTVVRTIDLGGQPDSIAISPDRCFAAIAIENERDEDLGDGAPPQLPAGFVVIIGTNGAPAVWTKTDVMLTGIPDKFPTDPEPEYVDINDDNIAVVTLQENNHCVLVDLETASVVGDFSCGTVSLEDIDTVEDDLITPDSSLSDVPREPDAVAWISRHRLATANEGDLEGGSRGFTIWTDTGRVVYESGNELEHETMRIGHYPENRSENKGNEPEGVAFGRYGHDDLLFVGSERANVIAVYQLRRRRSPRLLQVLPATVGPEGLLAIPSRDLFVVASEVDDRGDKIRSSITIYERRRGRPTYPTIESLDTPSWFHGVPRPWGALSALAADRRFPWLAYTAHDSFYKQSRIFKMFVGIRPAVIYDEVVLRDGAGDTIDLDIEGLAVARNGDFWVASEGAGSVDDPSRPVTSTNQLRRVAPDGTILQTVSLPPSVDALQRRFGFEGVASVGRGAGEQVYVAFQREWVGDPAGHVRIGRYTPATGAWAFFYYPLDAPTSPHGGWVGLSEIVHVRGRRFAVLERDNQGGPDARIKRIYGFSVAGVTPVAQGGAFPVLSKTLVRDLVPDLLADNGFVLEKVEGMARLANGKVLVVTDNDGVDDASGETQLLRLPRIFGR